MKFAADFRTIARNSLTGRWTTAVIAGLIASLLGAVAENGPELELEVENGTLEIGGTEIASLEQIPAAFLSSFKYLFLGALVLAAVYLIVGSVVRLGYARFNLTMVDRQLQPQVEMLFSYFSYWKTAVVASLLRGLFVFLWSLLLIVPGIVAGYSYAMTEYILAEHPELTASEALQRSKSMMEGNRWRLFCLWFSFIGWELLSVLTLGIGHLWITPYKQAATAAFYREISGTEDCYPVYESNGVQ